MNEITNVSPGVSSRREFIKTTGRVAAASALAGMAVPFVHAEGNETVQVALVGCGGRGTGAAANALSVKRGPTKLVAMADVFTSKLESSYDTLNAKEQKAGFTGTVDVTPERKFIGFDGYKHAMDCLKPGDIAIFTTPLAFRWVHFAYAVEKGLNVFMEKPLSADGPSSRKLLQLAEQASAKNLKCGVGLMSRHARPMQELAQRIENGEIGDIILMRGYRMASGPLAACFTDKWPGTPSELLWQISVFHSFIWASGGLFNDFYIHHLDHLCMMKNDWPVTCQALGGRHYRTNREGVYQVDQNFDSYSVEYTFKDGSKMYMDGRNMDGAMPAYYSNVHGSKGIAVVAASGDCNPPSSTHKGQNPTRETALWTSKVSREESNPYQNEWNDLMDAIRDDKPYNEVPRGVKASIVSNMGRMAAHTAQEVTYQEMLDHEDVYAPGIENFTMESPAPVRADKDGKYPVPMPGLLPHHEYEMQHPTGKEA